MLKFTLFHVSDTIIWGLYSTYSATIWDNRPFTLTVWSESLVLATVVPEKNYASALAASPTGNARRLLCNGQTAPVSGALGGALAPLWLPLPLLETKDCCEMTKHSHIQGEGSKSGHGPHWGKGDGPVPPIWTAGYPSRLGQSVRYTHRPPPSLRPPTDGKN